VNCIHLVQDEDKQRVLVNMAIKSGVPNMIMETWGRGEGEICWLTDNTFCTLLILEKKWE
jgi:hypothetical protein